MATESLILLNQTTVKSCKCYEQYWKTMKTSAFPYVEFNYSIEKTLSFRIHRQDLLYHFCINCFYDIVLKLSNMKIYKVVWVVLDLKVCC